MVVINQSNLLAVIRVISVKVMNRADQNYQNCITNKSLCDSSSFIHFLSDMSGVTPHMNSCCFFLFRFILFCIQGDSYLSVEILLAPMRLFGHQHLDLLGFLGQLVLEGLIFFPCFPLPCSHFTLIVPATPFVGFQIGSNCV